MTLPIGDFVATHDWVWPFCETLHFFGMSILLGTVGTVDLRVLGVAGSSAQWTFSPDLLDPAAHRLPAPADVGALMVRGDWPSVELGISPLWEN